jgi:hypothetical protein
MWEVCGDALWDSDALGGLVIAGIIVKGFWSGDRVKSIEQPDNWQKYIGGGGLSGGS